MLNLELAKFVQAGVPARVRGKVVGHAFGKENMTGVAAIHHPLGQINASAGHVGAIVHVLHLLDRTAVNADAETDLGSLLQRRSDLQRALERRLELIEEDQRHAITGRQAKQFAFRFRGAETIGLAHDPGQFADEQLCSLMSRLEYPITSIARTCAISSRTGGDDSAGMAVYHRPFLLRFTSGDLLSPGQAQPVRRCR